METKGDWTMTTGLDELDLDGPFDPDMIDIIRLIRQLHERLRLLEARIDALETSRMVGRHGSTK